MGFRHEQLLVAKEAPLVDHSGLSKIQACTWEITSIHLQDFFGCFHLDEKNNRTSEIEWLEILNL